MKCAVLPICVFVMLFHLAGCATRDGEAASFKKCHSMVVDDFTVADDGMRHLNWLIDHSYIKKGMSVGNVIELLGDPDLDQDNAAAHVLIYAMGPCGNFHVVVKDSQVVEYGIQREEGAR